MLPLAVVPLLNEDEDILTGLGVRRPVVLRDEFMLNRREDWVVWFNTCRLMAPLGYLPPAEYEMQFEQLTAAPRLLEHSNH